MTSAFQFRSTLYEEHSKDKWEELKHAFVKVDAFKTLERLKNTLVSEKSRSAYEQRAKRNFFEIKEMYDLL